MPPYKHGDWVVVDPKHPFYPGQHGEVREVQDRKHDVETMVRLRDGRMTWLGNEHLRPITQQDIDAHEDEQRNEAARARVYRAMQDQGTGLPGKSPIPGLGPVVPAQVRTGQPAPATARPPAPQRSLPLLPEEEHAARFRGLDIGPGREPAQPEQQETLPTRLSSAEYDYSHHLPEELRQQGWSLVGDLTHARENHGEVPAVHAYYDGRQDYRGMVYAERTSAGHNLHNGLSDDHLRDPAMQALSQHIDLHRNNKLAEIPARPAPLDLSPGKTPAPEDVAEEERPLRTSNPYVGKNKTPRLAKLVGHGPAVHDTIFQKQLGDAQAYDYSHHLSPEERQKGYGLTMYHWPMPQAEGPRTLSSPTPTQAGHSFLSVTHNGKGIGSGHHFEGNGRQPMMSRLADGHEDPRDPYGGVFAAAGRAFQQHRDLANQKGLPNATLKNRFAGLEIDKLAQKAKAKRSTKKAPAAASSDDNRFKWIETDSGPVRGEVEKEQKALQAAQEQRAAAEAEAKKSQEKAAKEHAAKQAQAERRKQAPTLLSGGSFPLDNNYEQRYEADYSHHLPEKWAGTHRLIVQNKNYNGHQPEAVVVRNLDRKVVANRGGHKNYRQWKGPDSLQESLQMALGQHRSMREAVAQAKPGDKLVPTPIQPGREMPEAEWQNSKDNNGNTLGERYASPERAGSHGWKAYDYSHLMPANLGGHKLWVIQNQGGDKNMYAHVMSADGRHQIFDGFHGYPNLGAQYYPHGMGNVGGGFRRHVLKAMHDHGRFVLHQEEANAPAELQNFQLNQPAVEENGPRVLSVGAEGHAMVRYNHHLPENMRETHRLAVYHNQGRPWASVERRTSGRAEATRGLHGRSAGDYQAEMQRALDEHATVANQLATAKPGDILRAPQRSAPLDPTPPAPATPAPSEAAAPAPSRFSLLETDGPKPAPPEPKPSFAPSNAKLPDAPKTKFNSRWEALELSEKANLGKVSTPLVKYSKESHGAVWLGRPVASHDHVAQLERAAAINEFGKRLPKTEAESKAYDDYIKDQRTDAAAFHLLGLKAAQGAGDRDAAEKHALMYSLHCKALGFEPTGNAPHASVIARTENHPDKLYKFRAHRGDLFALPDGKKGAQDPTKADK